MKDKKKWASIEAILKLLHDSQGHIIKEISKTLNTAGRKLQYSMHTKNSRLSEMDKSKRHRDKKKVYSTDVHLLFGMSLAVSIFMLLVAGVGVVSATNNYYVATWGDDSKSGTSLDTPWQHPSYAAQQAVAGDTIYLVDGTWYGEQVTFKNSGTNTQPILMKAYNGTPTLSGPMGGAVGVHILGREYILVSGITTINYGMGVRVKNSQHIIIENCTAGVSGNNGITLISSDHCEIRNCTAYNAEMDNFNVHKGHDNIIADCNSYNDPGLSPAADYCYGTDETVNLLVTRCVGRDAGHGICFTPKEVPQGGTIDDIDGSSYCTVTDCEMYNCWDLYGVRQKSHHITFLNCYGENPTPPDPNWNSHGFYFRTGAHDILVKNCRIKGVMGGLNPAYTGVGTEYGMTRDVTFENCIAEECINGIYADSAQNTKFINCVSALNEERGVVILGNPREVMLKSCIIYNNKKGGVLNKGSAPIQDEITYCNVWGNSPDYSSSYEGASPGEGCKSEDPLFADPANGDFHLKPDSPCIDTGDPSSNYTHEPAPNGGQINMGAYGNTNEATTSGPSGPDTIPPYTSGYNPAKDATGVSKDTSIVVHIRDDGDGVDKSSIEMTVEGVGVTPTITGNKYDYTLTYTTSFNYGQVVTVNIKAEDLASSPNAMPQVNYAFTIESTPPALDTTAPAAVTDLAASDPSSHAITLTWIAPGDDGDTGTTSQYDIRYSTTEIYEANWDAATQCTDEPTPQLAGSTETFTATALASNTTYYFALKTADEVPNWASISNCANGRTTEAVGDLVGYWNFGGDSATTAIDASGNGNTGTVYGASRVDGKHGNALEFDGVDDYVDCGNGSSLNITGNAITTMAWIKPASTYPQSTSGIVSKNGWQRYAVLQMDFGPIRWVTKTTNGIKQTSSTTPTAGIWHHIAATYNGSMMKLYIDGEKTSEIAQSGTIIDSAQDPLLIAKRDGDRWKGAIDEVKIYNKALSAEEIRADYEANGTNLPPVADPNNPYIGMEGVPLHFKGNGSYDPDGRIVAYLWTFGDGNNATGVNPTHTYAQNGTYTVTLTVTDNDGATNTSTTTADIESDLIPPYTAGHSPTKDAIEVAKDTTIVVHVKDDGAGVDIKSIVMTVNGITVTPTITGTPADYTLTYVPSVDFECGQIVNVTVDAHDLATAP